MWFRLSAAAVLGAVIPHLIVFILAFLWGVVFGAGDIMSSGPGHYVHGIEGGDKAVATVGAVYLLSAVCWNHSDFRVNSRSSDCIDGRAFDG